MLTIERTSQFKKQYRLMQRRGLDTNILRTVVSLLAAEQPLPAKYRDHALTGELRDYRECHLKPDWLLIYRVRQSRLVLTLTQTGSHADLFKL